MKLILIVQEKYVIKQKILLENKAAQQYRFRITYTALFDIGKKKRRENYVIYRS